jgi:hypothetical protein
VLATSARRRTDSVARRLGQLTRTLDRPRFREVSAAQDLRDEIDVFCSTAPALPNSGRAST